MSWIEDEADAKAKRAGGAFRPLYDIPFMFEAREFLRKKLIGHQVGQLSGECVLK